MSCFPALAIRSSSFVSCLLLMCIAVSKLLAHDPVETTRKHNYMHLLLPPFDFTHFIKLLRWHLFPIPFSELFHTFVIRLDSLIICIFPGSFNLLNDLLNLHTLRFTHCIMKFHRFWQMHNVIYLLLQNLTEYVYCPVLYLFFPCISLQIFGKY